MTGVIRVDTVCEGYCPACQPPSRGEARAGYSPRFLSRPRSRASGQTAQVLAGTRGRDVSIGDAVGQPDASEAAGADEQTRQMP